MGACMGVCWRHAMLPDTDTDTRTHPLSDVDACRGTELTQRRVAQPPEKEQPPVRHGTIPGGALRKCVCVCSCQSVCPPVCLYVCTWHVRALAARFFLQQDASTPASTPPSPVCTGVFACNAPARKARAHTSLLPHARAHTKMVLVERWGASRRETPGSVVLRARHTARRARGQVPSLALSAAICKFLFFFLLLPFSSP